MHSREGEGVQVKFGETTYTYDLDDELKSLTGLESAELEEFLGGWTKFRSGAATTRTTIVLIWLGKRAAKEAATLDEIAATPGLMFGEMVEIEGADDGPEDPTQDPGRPLAETNAEPESNGGSDDSERTLVTFGPFGDPRSAESTD